MSVYVESVVQGNQTILGVMGGDMTVRDMEAFTPYRKVNQLILRCSLPPLLANLLYRYLPHLSNSPKILVYLSYSNLCSKN